MITKIKEESVIEGYEIGNLKMVIQAVPDAQVPNRLVKGVFCTLNVKKEDKKESINFAFALNSVPDFRKHIISMIDQAIKLKAKSVKEKKVK